MTGIDERGKNSWFSGLEESDLAFIRRFVLSSGSLKDMAAAYGVSYPTVRLRLDRLIAKIQVLEDAKIESDLERFLRAAYAEGKIDADFLKKSLNLHKKETEGGSIP
ncbi:MAG: DUF2089 family protein [Spartobacteria bacterium]|nr:DUF2089 family protein [Spartobacteria bacterium]